MNQIASFTVNHNCLQRGIYISRRDSDVITFDLRMRAPYRDAVLTDIELHSLEHLLATALRNGACAQHVVYVGPMGCATGFYVLYRGKHENACVRDIVAGFGAIANFLEMPGASKTECGNCRTLNLQRGKAVAAEFFSMIQHHTAPDRYPDEKS